MNWKYTLAWHKGYFEKGLAFTNFVKYIIGFYGLASKDQFYTLMIAFIYAIFCYFLGMFLFKTGFVEAEQEMFNRNNLFVKEMRRSKFQRNI